MRSEFLMVRSAATPRASNYAAPSVAPSPGKERERESSEVSILRPELFDFGIAGQIIRSLAVDRIHHHTLAILLGGLADEGAKRRLVIDLAEGDFAERRLHRQAFGRGDQLLRIRGVGFRQDRSGGLDGLITDDRTKPRIIIVLGLICLEERIVLGRLDRVP